MAEAAPGAEMLTLDDAEREYGVKRATLYRYVRQGSLRIYRRGMDRRSYVRRADLEALREFRTPLPCRGLTLEAIERARAFQRRVFGDRVLSTPSSDLIEEARRQRSGELP